MAIEVGVEAPDFELRDQNGQIVRLSSFRGVRNVLLVFYPLDFTSVCTGELCSLRDNLGDFVNDKVQTLTISVDSAPAHKVFAEREGYTFPMLADFWPHGAVARAYGELERLGAVVTEGARGTRVAERAAPTGARTATPDTLAGLLRPVAVAAFHMGAGANELRMALEEAMKGIFKG